MKDEQLRAQINALIQDEIQEGINDYIDTKEESEKSGLGFVENQDEQLKVNISNAEVDRLIKEYKKIKVSNIEFDMEEPNYTYKTLFKLTSLRLIL